MTINIRYFLPSFSLCGIHTSGPNPNFNLQLQRTLTRKIRNGISEVIITLFPYYYKVLSNPKVHFHFRFNNQKTDQFSEFKFLCSLLSLLTVSFHQRVGFFLVQLFLVGASSVLLVASKPSPGRT